jgi:hypothetical protein
LSLYYLKSTFFEIFLDEIKIEGTAQEYSEGENLEIKAVVYSFLTDNSELSSFVFIEELKKPLEI